MEAMEVEDEDEDEDNDDGDCGERVNNLERESSSAIHRRPPESNSGILLPQSRAMFSMAV